MTEFHKDKKSKDGKSYYCKLCANKRVAQWKEESGYVAKRNTEVAKFPRKHFTKQAKINAELDQKMKKIVC